MLLNCFIVAMWIWGASRFRSYLWTRRSLHFAGLIPHFGTAEFGGWKRIFVREYVPHKSRVWTRDNLVILFRGRHRVWELRPVRVRHFKTDEEARAWIQKQKVSSKAWQ